MPQIMGSQTCAQHHEQSVSKQRVTWGQGWIYLLVPSKHVLTEEPRKLSQSERTVIALQAGKEISQHFIHFQQTLSSSISTARLFARRTQ